MLGGAFTAMGRYWKQLFGIAATAYGVAILVSGLALLIAWSAVREHFEAVIDVEPHEDPSWEDIRPLIVAFVVLWVVLVALMVLATTLIYASCPAVLQEAVLGRPTTFGAVWRRAWSRVPAVFGAVFLSGLVTAVPALLIGGALITLLVALAEQATPATVLPLAVLGMLALVPFSVWLWVRFSLAPSVAVFELQGPIASLRRSAHLVRGAWWRIFGIALLAFFIASVASYMIQLPFSFLGMFASLPGTVGAGPDPEPAELLVSLGAYFVFIVIGSMIGQIFAAVLPQLILGLLYIDQRIRRESLDISLAQAAGVPPAAPHAPPPAGPSPAGPPAR
ncbi:hypothetical protein [Streptomyces sp. GC420]|uniref:DUF7847 domain-containing protein n=1 Tax=Streptomyces sp. GC420 TaxID=2697568 RepID=UPI001415289D|nr:hypothetical protein [Streptomyces sp. GC420]NBM15648.1 hypothetical protein [Streptomyces sp. GC420]